MSVYVCVCVLSRTYTCTHTEGTIIIPTSHIHTICVQLVQLMFNSFNSCSTHVHVQLVQLMFNSFNSCSTRSTHTHIHTCVKHYVHLCLSLSRSLSFSLSLSLFCSLSLLLSLSLFACVHRRLWFTYVKNNIDSDVFIEANTTKFGRDCFVFNGAQVCVCESEKDLKHSLCMCVEKIYI